MDLNTLITTITTSTAALVAIIGGFLVSRVISISSEQNGIKRKIREINNDIFAKQEIINNIENYLFEDDLDDFVTKENIKRIIEGKSLEDIIKEDDYTYLSKEELEPHFEELSGITNEMFEKMGSMDKIYDTFSDFNKEFDDFKYPNRKEWYERAFEVIDELTQPKTTDVFGFSPGGIYQSINPGNLVSNTDYKDKKKERNRLKDDVKILELQKKEQLKILNDYGKPKWIWSGLAVLVYASIVGIVYPSTLLPYPIDTYDDSLTKRFILFLFFSQLLALFIYLGIAMYKLTYSEEDN
ncbi:hypothetical protein [Bacillus taeanensis]|uniref:Uncharacterized protein n=1 Tax=Bacillus taeanensis TaxID=273032 RepID=A0A366XRR4_9BACI|nr:hypothetical protein [Bacillus taeanensis]RBW68228.1 hypothetical protein DS031_17785 [Bacillus taeanensis]